MNKKFNFTGTVFLIIYLTIATSVMLNSQWVSGFDLTIIEMVQGDVKESVVSVITVLTEIGGIRGIIILTLIVVFILFFKKMYIAGFWFGGTILVCAGLLTTSMKILINRNRPDILPLAVETSHSFPSGHSTASTIFYGLVGLTLILLISKLWKKVIIGFVTLTIILFVMSSRIYLGVHFPTDVLGGFSFGAASVFISLNVYQLSRPRFQQLLLKNEVHDKSPSLFN